MGAYFIFSKSVGPVLAYAKHHCVNGILETQIISFV